MLSCSSRSKSMATVALIRIPLCWLFSRHWLSSMTSSLCIKKQHSPTALCSDHWEATLHFTNSVFVFDWICVCVLWHEAVYHEVLENGSIQPPPPEDDHPLSCSWVTDRLTFWHGKFLSLRALSPSNAQMQLPLFQKKIMRANNFVFSFRWKTERE